MDVIQFLRSVFCSLTMFFASSVKGNPIQMKETPQGLNFETLSETLLYKTVSHLRLALQKDIQLTDIKQCSSPNCITFLSRSELRFFIQINLRLKSHEILTDKESKMLSVPSLDFFDFSEKSIGILRQFLMGHEWHPDYKNSLLKKDSQSKDNCETKLQLE